MFRGLADYCGLARQRTLRIEQVRVDDLERVHRDLVKVRYWLHVVGDGVPVSLPRSYLVVARAGGQAGGEG